MNAKLLIIFVMASIVNNGLAAATGKEAPQADFFGIGSSLNIGKIRAGSQGGVKTDKEGNTEITSSRGLQGIYTEEEKTNVDKENPGFKGRRCLLGLCLETTIDKTGLKIGT
uniref:Uncharacterized protein n=1 Tax=Romanomermis culicivorax TaxID=13658 RepID=A0A915KWT8_ROMCU